MCIVYSSFLGHQTSLIAFFAQVSPRPRDEGFPIFGTTNLGGVVPSSHWHLHSLRDGVAASADGLIVQQSQR